MESVKFAKDSLVTFSTRVLTAGLGIAITIVIARALGPSAKGTYTLIILLPSLLTGLGNLGIGIANVYFVGSGRYRTADLVSTSLISALGLGIVFGFGFLAYVWLYGSSSFLGSIDLLYILIATATLPFSLLSIYFVHILLGEQRINQYNLLSIIGSSVSMVLVFVLLLGFKLGILGAVVAWAGSIVVGTMCSIAAVRRITSIGWRLNFKLFRESVNFGIKGSLANMITFLNFRLDMLLLAYFLRDVSTVGYYSVAVSIAEILWYFPRAVGTVIVSQTPRLTANTANAVTPKICRSVLFASFLGAVALFALGKYIIIIPFGSSFLPALHALWLLLPGVTAFAVTNVLVNELAGRGKPVVMLICSGVSLAVNIPLNLLLIPLWGIEGAALASSVSYTVTSIVATMIFLRVSKTKWCDVLILKRGDLREAIKLITKLKGLNFRELMRLLRS